MGKSRHNEIIVCSTQPDGRFGNWYMKDLGVAAYFKKPYACERFVKKSCELLKIPFNLHLN